MPHDAMRNTAMAPTFKIKLVRALRGGRITIPAEYRRELGIDENTTLMVTLSDGVLRITPTRANGSVEGSPELKALYEYFAPVREEILASGVSEEELNADIDKAIAEVRAERRAIRE
jgi:AbrB family looped-hinge helix DNA binding protein